MDPSAAEFLAEREIVKIIPNFSLDTIYLIGVRVLIQGNVVKCVTRTTASFITNTTTVTIGWLS